MGGNGKARLPDLVEDRVAAFRLRGKDGDSGDDFLAVIGFALVGEGEVATLLLLRRGAACSQYRQDDRQHSKPGFPFLNKGFIVIPSFASNLLKIQLVTEI